MNSRRLLAAFTVGALLALGVPATSASAASAQPTQDYRMKQVTGAKAKALIAKSGPGLSMACSKIYAPVDGSGTGKFFWAISKYGTPACPSYSGLTGTYWTIYGPETPKKGVYGSTRMHKKGESCDGDLYAAGLKWCKG
jgi:hypothetical protein